jgi:phenylalanyl-tRNA synthetase beta chain
MKLIYSHLKKFLPDLNVEPQQLRDDLTMIGHFTNFFEEIDNEIVFDLDIKVNRGDCLGYYGLARDLAVFYRLPLFQIPKINLDQNNSQLPITITTDNVKRVMALKISGLKNTESPDWLKTFIKLHGNNSINTIVDLTNYIMFMYGIPNHAFDTDKSGDELIWEMNSKYKTFTSLDGSKLELNQNILMINSPNKALSLSFWGGEACAIESNSTDLIIEMAVYNPTTVRQNSRQLKSVTEAATRLEKGLDPELIPLAFNHLADLILQNCGGQISSQIFDYYPIPLSLPQIEFDSQKPSLISGVEIPVDFALDSLNRLGCSITNNLITPPSIRPDINMEADLVEEVIRFWGYQKIPTNQPLTFKNVADITPKVIYLIDQLKDQLIGLGYDEILSWPLVSTPTDSNTVITTQNSINTEVIYLRQSLILSLKQQLDQYSRFKLTNCQFFEIGKVFFQAGDNYVEKNTLGIYCPDSAKLLNDLQKINPNYHFNIIDQNFAEIIIDDLSKPDSYTSDVLNQSAYELTSQLIILDANITLDTEEDPLNLIKKYSQIIGPAILWEMIITDIYHDTKTNKYRYTFRVSYFNTDDKTAKETHLNTFNLK